MNENEAKEFECPLLKHKCLGNLCMWWVVNIEEEENDSCAIVKLAKNIGSGRNE